MILAKKSALGSGLNRKTHCSRSLAERASSAFRKVPKRREAKWCRSEMGISGPVYFKGFSTWVVKLLLGQGGLEIF